MEPLLLMAVVLVRLDVGPWYPYAYIILLEEPLGQQSLRRSRRRWEPNIKFYLQDISLWDMKWIEMAPLGVLGFDSRRGLGIFLFTTASRMALGPTQPPIQWVPGALSLGVKRPGREADHSSPSSAEVKEYVELYIHSPNTPSWRGS
jgi:hypothetical protein